MQAQNSYGISSTEARTLASARLARAATAEARRRPQEAIGNLEAAVSALVRGRSARLYELLQKMTLGNPNRPWSGIKEDLSALGRVLPELAGLSIGSAPEMFGFLIGAGGELLALEAQAMELIGTVDDVLAFRQRAVEQASVAMGHREFGAAVAHYRDTAHLFPVHEFVVDRTRDAEDWAATFVDLSSWIRHAYRSTADSPDGIGKMDVWISSILVEAIHHPIVRLQLETLRNLWAGEALFETGESKEAESRLRAAIEALDRSEELDREREVLAIAQQNPIGILSGVSAPGVALVGDAQVRREAQLWVGSSLRQQVEEVAAKLRPEVPLQSGG